MRTKLLIVDDSESLRSQLRDTLEPAGFEIVEAADGVLGLVALAANPDVKLVFCDVNMPNMNGLEMATKMSTDPQLKSIPILMLTTETRAGMKEKGKQVGVRAWITKPFRPEQVVLAVKKILGLAA